MSDGTGDARGGRALTPRDPGSDSGPVKPGTAPPASPDAASPSAAPPGAAPLDAAPPTRISMRLDLGLGRRLGPGKVSLLEAIGRRGSIASAGRDFGMSYRRAWLLVDEMNRMFAAALVETRGGGKGGGGARLTAEGEAIVALYREIERKTQAAAASELSALAAALAPAGPASGDEAAHDPAKQP